MVVPSRTGRAPAACLVALVLTALTIVHLFPLSLSPGRLSVVNSTDMQEMMWRLLWGIHALAADPAGFLNANQFYPDEGTYTNMDYVYGLSVLALPLRALTKNPLLIFNLTAMLSVWISALGAYLLAADLTRDRRAAVVAAAVFAFNPIHLERLGQLNILSVHWMPFVLLAAHRLWQSPDVRRTAMLVGALFLAIITSGHQAVLASAALGYAIVVLVARDWRRSVRPAVGSLVAVGVAGLLFLPLGRPYVEAPSIQNRSSTQNQARALREVERQSPPPLALVHMDSVAHDWARSALDPNDPLVKKPFPVLFPGFVACGMAALGALVLLGRREDRHLLVLYGGLTAVGFVLSLGTNVPGYGLLFEWLAPLRMIRAPSRFSLVGLLGLAVLSAFAIRWLLQRTTGRRRRVAVAVVPLACLLHLAETAKPVGAEPYHYHPPPPVYQWIAEQPGEFAVVELPSDRSLNTFYLVYSTYHWKPLVNGFDGSFITAYHHRMLFDVLSEFPEPRAVRELSQIQGLRYIVVHTDPAGRHFRLRGHERTRRRLASALDHLPPTLKPVWSGSGATLLELVEPRGGWTGSTFHRFVPGGNMEGRRLRFEARAVPARVHRAERGIAVFVNGTEIYRRPIGSRFARHEVAIPEGAVRKGTNDLELRSVARLEFPVGSTGVQLGARLSAVAGKGHVSIDLDGRAEASSQLGYQLLVIDPETIRVETRMVFDTPGSRGEVERMMRTLRHVPAGRVVVLAARRAHENLTDEVVGELRGLGGRIDPRDGLADAYVLIGVKGAEPGAALDRAASKEEQVEVRIGSDEIASAVAVRRIEFVDPPAHSE